MQLASSLFGENLSVSIARTHNSRFGCVLQNLHAEETGLVFA